MAKSATKTALRTTATDYDNEPRQSSVFAYRPLTSTSELRLFRLIPGRMGDPIQGIIEHVDLDADPTPIYKTLSYVWGDPDVKSPIKISYEDEVFQDLDVTVNLEDLLQHIRRPEEEPWIGLTPSASTNRMSRNVITKSGGWATSTPDALKFTYGLENSWKNPTLCHMGSIIASLA
jgi:Heterokaryon incompatibility protein (HET)